MMKIIGALALILGLTLAPAPAQAEPGVARAYDQFDGTFPVPNRMRVWVAQEYFDTARRNSRIYDFTIYANNDGWYHDCPAIEWRARVYSRANGEGRLLRYATGWACNRNGEVRGRTDWGGIRARSVVVRYTARLQLNRDRSGRVVVNIPR